MHLPRAAERLMSMDDAVWARHANPWSVWTRATCLPLLSLAVWSRAWIGWWSLAPIALAMWWTWYNPRAFGPPASTRSWASHGVLGERVFLHRKQIPIPAHHARASRALATASGCGAAILIYGLAALDFWATMCGLSTVITTKLWFVDRMAWLYADMKDASPQYASWDKDSQ